MSKTPDSAFKAKADARSILVGAGYLPLDMDDSGSARKKALRSFLEVPRVALKIRRAPSRSVLVFQYPAGVVAGHLVRRVRRPTTVALVHDIESLRQQEDPTTDARILSSFDAVIVHSEQMKAWLRPLLGGSTAIEVLGLFDYLAPALNVAETEPAIAARPSELYLVGNLRPNKVGWIYSDLDIDGRVKAFGPFCEVDELAGNVEWSGYIDPDSPEISPVDGFGLVWDGRDAHELSPRVGDYLRYNSPHKLSFYLAAGLPVMVPEESAVGDVVVREGIGYRVKSVYHASQIVSECSPEEWRELTTNVRRIRHRLLTGQFTLDAVRRALRHA